MIIVNAGALVLLSEVVVELGPRSVHDVSPNSVHDVFGIRKKIHSGKLT